MSLTAKEVTEILQALESSSFDTLDLELNGVKLQLRRGGVPVPAAAGARAANPPVADMGAAQVARLAMPAAPVMPPAPSSAAAPVEVPPGTTPVPAPLLGIFYRAPRPGEPPFIEVGARVEADSIIGIIEVMKLMNTVRAGVRGEVVAIPARNGELVEYGESLLFVRPD